MDAQYVDAVELNLGDTAVRSPEQWARDSLEGAPRPLRWLILLGWRVVLGLELGPRRSPDHVLGWRIVHTGPDALVIEARSALLTARLRFGVQHSSVTWVTFVRYEHGAARVVWPPVGLLHRRIVPYALAHAASRPSLSGA